MKELFLQDLAHLVGSEPVYSVVENGSLKGMRMATFDADPQDPYLKLLIPLVVKHRFCLPCIVEIFDTISGEILQTIAYDEIERIGGKTKTKLKISLIPPVVAMVNTDTNIKIHIKFETALANKLAVLEIPVALA